MARNYRTQAARIQVVAEYSMCRGLTLTARNTDVEVHDLVTNATYDRIHKVLVDSFNAEEDEQYPPVKRPRYFTVQIPLSTGRIRLGLIDSQRKDARNSRRRTDRAQARYNARFRVTR